MGSLTSSTWTHRQIDEDSPQLYRVYASFSGKNPSSGANISNWIECYNPSTNSWSRVTSIPGLLENEVLKGFAMVTMRDFIYIIGGRLCNKEASEANDDSDVVEEVDIQVCHSVLRYSIQENSWFKCAPLQVSRFDFACTVCENRIYVGGGKCTIGSARGVSSAEVYDPALDEWKSLPDMSTSRYNCVGVTWQGKIYVVGGFVERKHTDIHGPFHMDRSSAEVYDTTTGKWDFLPRMWELDVPPNQIVVIRGRLFSCGDCYKKWKGCIESYDRELNMWDVVESSPTSVLNVTSTNRPPMDRCYLTMAPIGSRLYLLAGYRMADEASSRFRSDVHVFDTTRGGWMSFEPTTDDTEKELSCHCCVHKQAL